MSTLRNSALGGTYFTRLTECLCKIKALVSEKGGKGGGGKRREGKGRGGKGSQWKGSEGHICKIKALASEKKVDSLA